MKIKFLRTIQKDVEKVKNVSIKKKIKAAITQIKECESIQELSNFKKLTGHPSAYRMRIGDYRLGFFLEGDTVILARFVKRNDIYKLFP